MKFHLILIFLLGLILVSCSSNSNDSDNPFSCRIVLQDSDGNSLEGYKVQLSSRNYYESEDSRDSELLDIHDGDEIELLIMTYWDAPIDTIYAESGSSIQWYGDNYLGEPVIQGVYKYRLTSYQDGEVEYQQTRFMYLLYGIEEDKPGIIETSSNGDVRFTDITPLPGLYCTEELPEYDENGEYLGPLDISPNSYIFAQNSDGEIRYARREMIDGENSFTITWDEMTIVN